MLAAITQTLQNIIDAWQKLGNRPSFVLGALRTAQTMVYKALEWQVKDVPEKDFMAVIRDIGYHQVGIMEYEPVRRDAP